MLAALWAGSSEAQTDQPLPVGTVLESSVETTTDQVRFPPTVAGRIEARACATCQLQLLQLGPSTAFNLAGQQVSLQEMAAYCAAAHDKALTIHYRLRDSIVSLVSVLEK